MPEQGALLGIDYGLERTGLALANAESGLAFPLTVLELRKFGNRSSLLDALAACAVENGCAAMVLGLPLHADGSENEMCARFRNVAKKIARRIDLPIHFMPEILTSKEARANLRNCGLKGEKLNAALDMEAARIILQSWINLKREETA